MGKPVNRRDFIKTAAAGTVTLGLAGKSLSTSNLFPQQSGRIGIIGLDTSHSVAFTKTLNDPAPGPEFEGYRIVAAYPKGSNDIKSSVDRIPGYIEDVKKLGVEIAGSIDELLEKVDFVLLETNDGRLHFEQAIPVMKAGKRMFIDKPIAASLVDAIAIFEAAKQYNVPVFSSSSLRYISGAKEISGRINRKSPGCGCLQSGFDRKDSSGSFLVWNSWCGDAFYHYGDRMQKGFTDIHS